jgi:CheY-like chemotaxis protein
MRPNSVRVRRCILVADDDPLIRRLVAMTLERVQGFDLVEAGDGIEAVTLAAEHHPEIVFLDIDMPRMDGYEACTRIRAAEGTAGATIVMLTAARPEEAGAQAEAAGADRLLTKPFSPLVVLRLVDRVGAARR